jgi:hypothetical protein
MLAWLPQFIRVWCTVRPTHILWSLCPPPRAHTTHTHAVTGATTSPRPELCSDLIIVGSAGGSACCTPPPSSQASLAEPAAAGAAGYTNPITPGHTYVTPHCLPTTLVAPAATCSTLPATVAAAAAGESSADYHVSMGNRSAGAPPSFPDWAAAAAAAAAAGKGVCPAAAATTPGGPAQQQDEVAVAVASRARRSSMDRLVALVRNHVAIIRRGEMQCLRGQGHCFHSLVCEWSGLQLSRSTLSCLHKRIHPYLLNHVASTCSTAAYKHDYLFIPLLARLTGPLSCALFDSWAAVGLGTAT